MGLKLSFSDDGSSWSLLDGSQPILSVTETEDENCVVMALSGSLRSDTDLSFRDELVALTSVGKDIVVDCENLQYISNACQMTLLSVQQQMDSLRRGTLTIRNLPPEIYKEFEKINLDELLMIE